ncbi:MAG: caspase family protein [Candidatus Thorarchaeota archaeon]|nr:caspase family protein [Candidatus Thorarchaeota archaeon]
MANAKKAGQILIIIMLVLPIFFVTVQGVSIAPRQASSRNIQPDPGEGGGGGSSGGGGSTPDYFAAQSNTLDGLYFPKASVAKLEFEVRLRWFSKIRIDIARVRDTHSRYLKIYIDDKKIKSYTIDSSGFHKSVGMGLRSGIHRLTLAINYGGYSQYGWKVTHIYGESGAKVYSVYFPKAYRSKLVFDFRAGKNTLLDLMIARGSDSSRRFFSAMVDGSTVVPESNRYIVPWSNTKTFDLGDYSLHSHHKLTLQIRSGSASKTGWKLKLAPNSGDGMRLTYGDGVVRKWAVIVGISDYRYISDLSYCDEDATDWYNYLHNVMHYNYIRVYGDGHRSHYPIYSGLATESNVKAGLNWLAHADGDDQVAFITSGHGSGNGKGSSYLCMWDCKNSNGKLYDTELASIVKTWVAAKTFIFVDHCYSGGLIPEIRALAGSARVFMTTTCTDHGYGWDDGTHHNGAWTYYFLEYGLVNHYGSNPNTLMESCFSYAKSHYPHTGADTPQKFDGDIYHGFRL